MELNKQISEVQEHFPTLSFNEMSNSLEGELFISPDDSYDISIHLAAYPKHFPHVYETEERIPKKVNRHVYSDTGSCCLSTKAKAQVLLKTKIRTLHSFIKEIVIPYFQNNSFYEINGRYKTEEYSHNSKGIIEGYQDILNIDSHLHIVRLIISRLKGDKLKIKDACYCGSSVSIKRCQHGRHYVCYKDFCKIDKDVLLSDLKSFKTAFNS